MNVYHLQDTKTGKKVDQRDYLDLNDFKNTHKGIEFEFQKRPKSFYLILDIYENKTKEIIDFITSFGIENFKTTKRDAIAAAKKEMRPHIRKLQEEPIYKTVDYDLAPIFKRVNCKYGTAISLDDFDA